MARNIADLDPNFKPMQVADGLNWYDVKSLGVEGKAWDDTAAFYDRLPARAEKIVRPPVWELSHHTAGMAVRFATDARQVTVKWTTLNANLAMAHMPASGVSGVDLYAWHDGAWRWAGCGIPSEQTTTSVMGPPLLPGKREYLLYLPLYNGVTEMAIGVPEGCSITRPEPRDGGAAHKPFVAYGTSITQGGCASRAGMSYIEIMARNLDRPSINLGFSGNGPMDLEMADFLAELDPSVFYIDSLPNMNAEQVKQRAVPFITKIRQAHPDTPIVLVENIVYQRSYVQAPGEGGWEAKNAELKKQYQTMLDNGLKGIHYVKGENLLGTDGLGAVDGTHPTDLGYFRMAEALTPVLRPLV